jgi:hypothetical protein
VKPNFSIKDCMSIAEAKAGVEGWQGYRWQAAQDDCIVTGCVPAGIYLRGTRKGQPRYSHPKAKDRKQVVVSKAEMLQEAQKYETETGKCWDCKGTGQRYAGWHHIDGTRFRPCVRCSEKGTSA